MNFRIVILNHRGEPTIRDTWKIQPSPNEDPDDLVSVDDEVFICSRQDDLDALYYPNDEELRVSCNGVDLKLQEITCESDEGLLDTLKGTYIFGAEGVPKVLISVCFSRRDEKTGSYTGLAKAVQIWKHVD